MQYPYLLELWYLTVDFQHDLTVKDLLHFSVSVLTFYRPFERNEKFLSIRKNSILFRVNAL